MSLNKNNKTLQRISALSTPQGFTAISLLFYILMQHKAIASTAATAPMGEALIPVAFHPSLADPSAELVFEADTPLINFSALSLKGADPHQNAMTLVTQSLKTPSQSPELASTVVEDDSAAIESTEAPHHHVEITATSPITGVEGFDNGGEVAAERHTNIGENINVGKSQGEANVTKVMAVVGSLVAFGLVAGISGSDSDDDTKPGEASDEGFEAAVGGKWLKQVKSESSHQQEEVAHNGGLASGDAHPAEVGIDIDPIIGGMATFSAASSLKATYRDSITGDVMVNLPAQITVTDAYPEVNQELFGADPNALPDQCTEMGRLVNCPVTLTIPEFNAVQKDDVRCLLGPEVKGGHVHELKKPKDPPMIENSQGNGVLEGVDAAGQVYSTLRKPAFSLFEPPNNKNSCAYLACQESEAAVAPGRVTQEVSQRAACSNKDEVLNGLRPNRIDVEEEKVSDNPQSGGGLASVLIGDAIKVERHTKVPGTGEIDEIKPMYNSTLTGANTYVPDLLFAKITNAFGASDVYGEPKGQLKVEGGSAGCASCVGAKVWKLDVDKPDAFDDVDT